MNETLIEQLAVQVAQLRGKVEELQSQLEESGGDSMDDLFLRIGNSSAGGGSDYGAFRWEGDKITHCNFQFGRAFHHLSDVQASGDGTYYLKVPHDYPSQASIITTNESSDLTKTVIKLFQVSGGEIIDDYRGMPVIPVRE